jgi:hypothetical protein
MRWRKSPGSDFSARDDNAEISVMTMSFTQQGNKELTEDSDFPYDLINLESSDGCRYDVYSAR